MEIEQGKIEEIKAESTDLSVIAQAAIVDQASYDRATAAVQAAKGLLEKIGASYDPIIADAHKAHKSACDAKKAQAGPVEAFVSMLKGKLAAYYTAQEEKRKAAEQAAEEERRAKEAEARRQAEEAQRAEREAAEALGVAPEVVAAIVVEAAPVVVEAVAPTVALTGGVSYRTDWKAEVVDFAALPDAYKMANEKAINAMAAALKDKAEIPGVRFFSIKTPVSR
jgi:hypothetical protein